mmetsp:Transcript_115018/g.303724  ORF Transcript_115018/g.303724 Transcript_115018/m.303724 type:complete len:262 (-) Transcript_115018:161-946(-)
MRRVPVFLRRRKVTPENKLDQPMMHRSMTIWAPITLPNRPVAQLPSPSVMQWKPLLPWKWSKPLPQSKTAAARMPQHPQKQWTGTASRGSSTSSFTRSMEKAWYTKAPMRPIENALPASTFAQGAVMDTRPARMPLHMPQTSYAPIIKNRRKNTVRPPVAALMVVFITTWAASSPTSSFISSVDPQLKPFQPNHRMKVPSTTRGRLCGSNSPGCARQAGKRPLRAPSTSVPTSPATPPVTCTTPLPAKSTTPTSNRVLIHP